MNEFKDKGWEEYWLPKIKAECREYKIQKEKDKELIKNFIAIHLAVLFLVVSISFCSYPIYALVKRFQKESKLHYSEQVPYTYRNID